MPTTRRMRTIAQAAAYIRKLDPETALTETAIRRLVKQRKIPHIPAASKQLIALEDLEEYLEYGEVQPAPERGTIRRIDERRARA